jgi:hypothetical protein
VGQQFLFSRSNTCPVKHDIFCLLTYSFAWPDCCPHRSCCQFESSASARGMIWTCQVSMILKNILGTHFLMLSIISIYLSCQESSGIIWFSCLNFPHCTVVDSVWFRRSLGWKSSCLARHDAAKTATLRLFWCRVPLHYKLFLACTGHVWSYS